MEETNDCTFDKLELFWNFFLKCENEYNKVR